MARPMIIVQRRLESVGQGRERPALPTTGALSLAQAKAVAPTPAPAAAAPSPESQPINPSPQRQPDGPSPIERLAALYPAVFDFHAPKPLAIGAHQDIVAALPDLPHSAARRLVKRWTRRANYLSALAAPGSRRFHLDGSDAGEVSDDHRAHAAETLAAMTAVTLEPDTPEALVTGLVKPPFVRRERMRIAVNSKRLKVTTVLDATALADLRVPDNAQPRSEVTVIVNGRQFRCDIATKSLRRAVATISEHGADNVAVLVQGALGAGDEITEAGLVAQPKAPKAEAA